MTLLHCYVLHGLAISLDLALVVRLAYSVKGDGACLPSPA